MRITDWDRVTTDFGSRVTLLGEPLDKLTAEQFACTRFRVGRGGLWQRIGGPR